MVQGHRYVPLVRKKKRGKKKEVHTVKRRIIGYTRGDGSVGDGILRVNVGISLVGRIEMFILTNEPEMSWENWGSILGPRMTRDDRSTDIAV